MIPSLTAMVTMNDSIDNKGDNDNINNNSEHKNTNLSVKLQTTRPTENRLHDGLLQLSGNLQTLLQFCSIKALLLRGPESGHLCFHD